jgi:hypothetical protein
MAAGAASSAWAATAPLTRLLTFSVEDVLEVAPCNLAFRVEAVRIVHVRAETITAPIADGAKSEHEQAFLVYPSRCRSAPMRRSSPTPGTFIRIRLADGSFGYGRVLEPPYEAFYDYRTVEPSSDLDTIASKAVLFVQTVGPRGRRNWRYIGFRKLEGQVAQPVVRYMQDLADYRKCVIFDSIGMERKVGPDECVGLEQAAVWEPHHIEERLLDTFMGRPNDEEVRSRVRLR